MAEEKKTEVAVKVDPFRVHKVSVPEIDLSYSKVIRAVGMAVDKDTLVTSPVFEEVDIQEEIESCKDLAGLDYMRKLLQQGKVSLEDLQDNANQDYDLTQIPESIHEANKQANALNSQIAGVAQAIGLKSGESYSAQQVEDALTAYIKDVYAKQQASVVTEGADK